MFHPRTISGILRYEKLYPCPPANYHFGNVIGMIGYSVRFYSTPEFLVSANLAIIAAGLSHAQVVGFNIDLETTPRQFCGISLGMTVLFNLVGGSI